MLRGSTSRGLESWRGGKAHARLRESLMQNITKSCDILETDRANATELGIRSHGRIKPQNSHVSQKQMADAVSQESQCLCLPNVPARTILFPCLGLFIRSAPQSPHILAATVSLPLPNHVQSTPPDMVMVNNDPFIISIY